MKKFIFATIVLSGICGAVNAQVTTSALDPTIKCSPGMFHTNITTEKVWACVSVDTWSATNIDYASFLASVGGGLADPGADGLLARTAFDTTVARTVMSPTGTLITSNPDGTAGNPSLDVDTAIFPVYSSGTGDVSATGAVGSFYAETDANSFYTYPSTNTEHWLMSIAAGAVAGDLFQTSATDVLAAITSTDDNTLVSDGSTWAKKALPDCDDTAGNHLNYDTGTNAYTCGTSGGGASFDPGTTLSLYNEYLGGTTGTGTQGNIGGFSSAQSTGTFAYVAGGANNPGLLRISTHVTNDNSGGNVGINSSTGLDTSTAFDTEDFSLDGVYQVGSNSTAITNVGTWFGLWDRWDVLSPTYCIQIRFDSDESDATFIFQVGDTSASTGCQATGDDTDSAVVASTITPVAGTFYRFRIRRDTTGVGGNDTIYMRVNDETEKTFCSSGCDDVLADAPTGQSLQFGVGYVTRTTTGVLSADLDYLQLIIPGLVRY